MIWNELKELQKLFDDYIFSEPLKLLLTYDEIRYNHYIKPLQTIHNYTIQNHSHEYGTAFHSENCIWDCSGWTKSMKSGNYLIFFY